MSKASVSRTTQDRYADLFMGFMLFFSLLAAIGWLVNMPILASYSPAYLPMAPGTALIFLGLWGTWVIGRAFPGKGGTRIAILAIQWGLMIIVVLLVFRALTGLGPDLETLIYPNPPLLGQITTGRMSPLAALGFLMAIPGLLLMTARKQGQPKKSATAGFGLVMFILSSIILLGYLYRAPLFYGGTTIPVSLPTALSFWFLSLGLLEMAGPASWPVSRYIGHSLRARLMRALIPTLILVVLLQGLLSTIFDPWISNPAFKVAIAAIIATLIVITIISLIVKNLSADFDRGQKAEADLAKSEAELRALFASMKDVVIVYDIDGRYIEIAPTDPSNLYRPPHEMLDKTVHDILPKDVADYNVSMIREAIQSGKVVTGEYALHIGSKEVWFAASTSRLSETTAILVAHDITQRKLTEQILRESESRFHAIFEQAAIGVAEINSITGEFVRVNQKYCEIFGYSREEMLRMRFQEISHPDDLPDDLERMKKLLNGEIDSFTMEKRHYRSNHAIIWLNLTVSPLWAHGEKPDYHIAVIEDITQRKRFELVQNAVYRITQASITGKGIDELYQSIHSILGELIPAENFYIALYDPVKGTISFPYYIDQFDEAPPTPTPLQGLTGYVIRTGRPLLAPPEVFDRLVRQGEVEVMGTTGEYWMGAPLKVEGHIIGVMAVQSYSKAIHFDQEDLNLLEFVSTQMAQLIDRNRMEQEIVSLSLTDELTGLHNRRGFILLAEHEMKLAYRFKRSVSLFFCDLDDLKMINDTYGHAEGDEALKEVSAILKETFREADIPARIGGDEFVILAPDTSIDSAEILPKRLQTTVENHNLKGKRPYPLTFSVGMARFTPDTPHTINELISMADELMYQQKKEKKGN